MARSPLLTSFILIFLVCIPTGAQAEQQHLKVGVITALTGKMSTIGTAVKNGIELARLESPKAFSHISFIYEDDQFEVKQSISAFQKLKDIDHVSLIFGFGDSLGIVLGPMAERDKIPLVNFNFDAIAAGGKSFVIRSLNHTEQYMGALASYLQKQGNSHFFIVRTESPFFNAMANSFKSNLSSDSSVQEIGAVNPGENDFRSIILKLLTRNAGPVGLFLSPDQLISFAKQAKDLRLSRTYFGTDLFETAVGISPETDLFQGALYPDNNVSEEFRSNYKAKFKNESQLTFAGSGYDMANLIRDSTVPVDFLHWIESVLGRTGALGKFSFVNDKKFGKFFEYPVKIKQISGRVGLLVD